MTVAIERQVRSLNFVPKKGRRIFAVNLKLVDDVGELWQIAKTMGFIPELVHMSYGSETPQVYALLWEGNLSDAPADLDEKFDALAEQINSDAIYFAAGRSYAEYLAAHPEIEANTL
jgi:hypothetical protein